MAARLKIVDPDRAVLVHGTEMQQQPAALWAKRRRQGDGAAVPQEFIGLQDMPDAGERRFRGKGDDDLPLHGGGTDGGLGDGVLPRAVKVEITLPPQLRTGVFRQGMFPVECFAPGGQHGFGHSRHLPFIEDQR